MGISGASPCSHNFHEIMDTTTELNPVDQSVYGLVVFLVIFLLFASLTSGLLVCLTKIWCGFKNGEMRQRQQSIRHSPGYIEEESDEESSAPPPLPRTSISGRRFSQRLMSYVHKLGDSSRPREMDVTPEEPSPAVYGADAQPLPTISTNVSAIMMRNGSLSHDPSTIVHV